MKHVFSILLIFVLTSCESIQNIDSRCSKYNIDEFQEIEEELREKWPTGPDDFDISNIKVNCVEELINSHVGEFVYGVTFLNKKPETDETISTIFIVYNPLGLRYTSYAHELIHVSLWNTKHYISYNHDGEWTEEHSRLELEMLKISILK